MRGKGINLLLAANSRIMELMEIRRLFRPAIDNVLDLCAVSDSIVDKELFQIYMATIWGNTVLEPARTGLEEADLSMLHDFLNEEIERVLGKGKTVTSCYEFIVDKKGDESLTRCKVSKTHREFLHYFARLILQREVGI